jgi:hypothetical protein
VAAILDFRSALKTEDLPMIIPGQFGGKYRNIFFSEAIALIEPKLCINHWKVLYKLCVFYVDCNSKMTTTAGYSFYIGPIQTRHKVMSK